MVVDGNFSGPAQRVLDCKVIVALGSGGVGKTTTAAALAVLAAKQGKRVGLLSIDPAKRLADAMGIKLGSRLTQVNFDSKHQITGRLDAAMLDQKAVFDEMVTRWAKSEEIKEKIFSNSIYKEVSTNFGGPLEYMALAKLGSMWESQDYDLIILDTPPDVHALDFLERPNILSGFVEGGVMTWMVKPFYMAHKLGAGRLLKAGGKLMAGVSSVTGVKMLQMLSEFLILMEEVIRGFSVTGEAVSKILRNPSTSFILVAGPSKSSLRSAKSLIQELKSKRFPLGGLFVNRCFPSELSSSLDRCYSMSNTGPLLDTLSKKRAQSAEIVTALKEIVDHHFDQGSSTVKIEESQQLIQSIDSLLEFAGLLSTAEPL